MSDRADRKSATTSGSPLKLTATSGPPPCTASSITGASPQSSRQRTFDIRDDGRRGMSGPRPGVINSGSGAMRLRNWFATKLKFGEVRDWSASYSALQDPIRSELFSIERLETYAANLASQQLVTIVASAPKQLIPRLLDNTAVLIAGYRVIAEASRTPQPITPAAEWLLDNFHIVDEQIREIKNDLPPSYYRMLPKLTQGPLAGYPRIYEISWAFVSHTDSVFDVAKLTHFVDAYQKIQPLKILELWAISIHLRITLVENLRRLVEAIVFRLDAGRLADDLADEVFGMDADTHEAIDAIRARLDQAPWSDPLAVQLAQGLRDRDPESTPALKWLIERLTKAGTDTDALFREEIQRQTDRKSVV